jgi:hypothetical protein
MEARPPRRNTHARRRLDLAALERLEGRDLLTTSPLGLSLPDLTVSGFAAPVAAWGGPLAVTVDVENLASTSQIQPLALAPGSASPADVTSADVAVFVSARRRFGPDAVQIGTITVPGLTQNTEVQQTQTFTLPSRPAGFPGVGGQVFVTFEVNPPTSTSNPQRAILESDVTNNIATARQPVRIQPALPDLRVVGLDVPPVMQPGDTIQPQIKIANFGTVDTQLQGPVVVDLVASTSPTFTSGSTVVEQFTIVNIPPQSIAPTQSRVLGTQNVIDPPNVETLFNTPIATLPTQPPVYFLGVVVDPNHTIRQISRPSRQLSEVRRVGPPIPGLPRAGVIAQPSPITSTTVFPFPNIPAPLPTSVTSPSTASTLPSSSGGNGQ